MKRSYESQLEEGLRDREQQVYLRDREISRLRDLGAALVGALEVDIECPLHGDTDAIAAESAGGE